MKGPPNSYKKNKARGHRPKGNAGVPGHNGPTKLNEGLAMFLSAQAAQRDPRIYLSQATCYGNSKSLEPNGNERHKYT